MIHIIQCLCPQRHAIFAVAFDSADQSDEIALAVMQSTIEEGIAKQIINPWCGICESREWHYETRATKWATMEEATPHLKRIEAGNRESRAYIDALKANKN